MNQHQNLCDYAGYIPDCIETFSINLGATYASQDFLIQIVDKFNNIYELAVTSDENGVIEIDTTNEVFPESLFNQFAGLFELTVLDSEDTIVKVNDGYVVFFDIKYISGYTDTNFELVP